MKTRKKLIKRLLIILLIISIGVTYYYSRYIAPKNYVVTDYTISDTMLPDTFNGFTIGYISDINLSLASDIDRLEKIVSSINEQNFDMVIFGGDLYDKEIFDDTRVIELLNSITSSSGKFAVLGEKDILVDTKDILVKSGFEVLHNEYRPIYNHGEVIHFYGLENNGDITGLKPAESDDKFHFVTVHQPDYFATTANAGISLQLSGHNLGGYINIPFIGGIFNKEEANLYSKNSIEENMPTLLISNGLGNESTFEYRFNAPLEILSITLTK